MKHLTRLFDLLDLYRDKYPTKPDAFLSKSDEVWKAYSSADYISLTHDLSLGLLDLGIKPGTRIATVMANCPEWNLFDMAIMQIGAIQVPIYPNISEENYRYILSDSRIEYLIVYNQQIYKRIQPIAAELSCVKEIYSIQEANGIPQWTEILEEGKLHPQPGILEEVKASIQPDDLVSIIYTSGTTGLPKGVMLSHRNFVSNFLACATISDYSSKDRALSFLPLCHVYERMLNYVYQYFGMSIYYAQSLELVPAYLQEVKPHTFAAVPRMLEKIYNKMVSRGRNLKGIRKVIFFWALRLGYNFELNHVRGWWYE
ncbi:MAG: AMP-binding protein, partial [Bacteroidia bacterium]|nr:AMP-binding protein [Bacteroidia bacterium]